MKKIIHFLVKKLIHNPKGETDPQKSIDSLRYIPLLVRLIWDCAPQMVATSAVLRLLSAFLPVSMLYIGKLIIDEVLLIINHQSLDNQYIWQLIAIELGLAILSDWLGRVVQVYNVLIGEKFANESSIRLIKHAAILDLYQFETAEFYDKLEKARQQTSGRVVLLWELLSLAQRSISVLILAIGLITFNYWLIILLFIAVLPTFISETHFNVIKKSLYSSYTPQRRELDYLRYIGASDVTAKEVKIFNLSNFLAERYEKVSSEYYQSNRLLTVKSAWWGGFFFTFGTVSYYGAYVWIIYKAILGNITLGDLTFLSGTFMRMREQLQTIMEMFSGLAGRALYLQDFFDFFEIKPQIANDPNPLPVPKPFKKGFTFENVSFKYPNAAEYSIRNVSFELKSTEKIALVGENGAGKTTLVKLLARLYEPTEGRILLDGEDLRRYNLAELREAIGVIFQDFVKFQLNAAQNIAIGDIEERENQTKIEHSAEKSLASEVIKKLPKGYEQMLGHQFKEAINLSGGEWQKIAIARAYMREAQLLILDEPTAALDARAEHEVFVRFANLIEGKSAILISHRFSTVRMADRILFLERGELKEIGSHAELLVLNGKYAELFNLQAKGYQ